MKSSQIKIWDGCHHLTAKLTRLKINLGIDRDLTQPLNKEKRFENIDALLSTGASKTNLLVGDENAGAIKTWVDVLEAKAYRVLEAAMGQECIEKAMAIGPDMIILNSVLSEPHEIVKTWRLETVLSANRTEETTPETQAIPTG